MATRAPADRIGIEFISVFGQHPVEFVHLAADLGCRHVGMALEPIFETPLGLPPWSLRDDAALRRELARALGERGVSISVGEGFLIWPDREASECARDLELLAELGVGLVNVCLLDPDTGRGFDQLATLVELAEGVGCQTTLEWGPIFPNSDLPTALAALRHVGRDSLSLLIDTLHFCRAGLGPKDLAALDPGLVGYAQLCDALVDFTPESYANEAQFQRLVPGTGELPLAELVAALPGDVVLGLEVPQLREALAGDDARTRLGRCVQATRELLARVEA